MKNNIDILDGENKPISKEILKDKENIPYIFKGALKSKKTANKVVLNGDIYLEIDKDKWKNLRTGDVIRWNS